MQRQPGLPVDLPIDGRAVLVAGGGPRALGKVALLRDHGAVVTVVAPAVDASIADLADRALITWHPREPAAADLDGVWLVVAATGDPADDARISELAATRQLFCLPGSAGESVGAPSADPGVPGTGAAAPPDPGTVILVGGGPGDPGLLTVAGLAAVRAADVIVHDRLAPLAVLDQVRPGATIIDVAKVPGGRTTPQHEINRLLVEHATAGHTVVRLKGGDNFVFGRGGEEWQACAEAGIEVRVIPGVSSALAVPALAGIPLTHRTANQGFTVITGHVPPGDPRSTLDYAALARSRTALVIMMGVANLGAIAAALIAAGMDPRTPAATVADGSLPGQRLVKAPLDRIAAATADAGIRAPAISVIGSVAAFDPSIAS
ncbi:uroporphyrinogen-III C-methyltransferase [Nakamurella sp. GG22]